MSSANLIDSKLMIDNKEIQLEFPVYEIVEFDRCVVVCLHPDTYKGNNDNVLGVDYSGQLVWKIPEFEFMDGPCPYVNIKKLKRINSLPTTGMVFKSLLMAIREKF